MLTLSLNDAQYALSKVHGFESMKQGIEGVKKIFLRHQCIQSDPIDVAGRNADLTLQSRVLDYTEDHLNTLLYTRRDVFEYYCKAFSIQPMEKYPVFHWLRKQLQEKYAPFFKEYKNEIAEILKMMEEAPLSSLDLKNLEKTPRNTIPLSRAILGRLWACGKTAIHHREGSLKYYGLIEDIIPGEYLTQEPDDEECIKGIASIITRASRLISPSKAAEQWRFIGNAKKVRQVLDTLEKEGVLFSLKLSNHKWNLYALTEDKHLWEDPQPPEADYVRFLAPLDPLLWNRALFKTVCGLEYFWEAYRKPENRVYGYYCLPVLFNGNAVGLIEPFLRKKEKVLEIRRFYMLNVGIDRERFMVALEAELRRFSGNLRAEALEVTNGGSWLKNIHL